MSTDSPTRRGPYAPSLRRRGEIAQAVLDLVDELGHDKVTTALVAERSGIGEATVLYHFPTKDHLLVAALERADELLAAASRVDADDLEFDLEGFLHGGRQPDARRRLEMMLRGQAATPGHPAFDYFRRRTERGIEIFSRIIRQRQAAGLAHPAIDAVDTARSFFAFMEGLGVLEILGIEVDFENAIRDGFRRLTGANWMEARQRLLSDDAGL